MERTFNRTHTNLPHRSSNNCLAKITWDSGQPSSANRERNRLREPLGPSVNTNFKSLF